MTENKDEGLLSPDELREDTAKRFMEKYEPYFQLKRDLTPSGNLISPKRELDFTLINRATSR